MSVVCGAMLDGTERVVVSVVCGAMLDGTERVVVSVVPCWMGQRE